MPQKLFDAEGNEVEAFTTEEIKQKEDELATIKKEKEDLLEEKKRLEEGGKDKNENIVKIRTALEEKDRQIGEITKKLTDKEEYEKKSVKDALISHYAGDDEESRKKLEAEYGFINMDETNPDQIAARMEKAAKVSGLYKEEGKENPAFKGFWGGSAPIMKPTKQSEEADNIINTPKGKGALAAMGVPTEEKKDK